MEGVDVGFERLTRGQKRELLGAPESAQKKHTGTFGEVWAKKPRLSQPAKAPKLPKPVGTPPGTKWYGTEFESFVFSVRDAGSQNKQFNIGARVWVKMPGWCSWPAVVWSLDFCRRSEMPAVLRSYSAPGKLLVHFYGTHEHSWVPSGECEVIQFDRLRAALHRQNAVAAAAAGGSTSVAGVPAGGPGDDGADLMLGGEEEPKDVRLEALRAWGRKAGKAKVVDATLYDLSVAEDGDLAEVQRIVRAREAVFSLNPRLVGKNVPRQVCNCCRESGAELSCRHCMRHFHPLCLSPPALCRAVMPDDWPWSCPACGEDSTTPPVGMPPATEGAGAVAGGAAAGVDGVGEEGDEGGEKERMGLTPDWIIHTAAFHVFQLARPTPEVPYIKGLLDPCTNSKVAPNIPAEVLYDKRDNGLKLTNSWTGYYIILNPDFRSQIQWRFVNRAIDEVENDSVPAVVLICRNSTDTAYFQRLRPYPRVMLRRTSARFKDYDKTPIGFGVAVFCLAKPHHTELYRRFFDGFADWGEPNIPIDRELIVTSEFRALLDRLRQYAEQFHRDHWVQCADCSKWRLITYDQMQRARDDDHWTCKLLYPPHSTCNTPQMRVETYGVHYAASAPEEEGMLGLSIWHGRKRGADGPSSSTVSASARLRSSSPGLSSGSPTQQEQPTEPESDGGHARGQQHARQQVQQPQQPQKAQTQAQTHAQAPAKEAIMMASPCAQKPAVQQEQGATRGPGGASPGTGAGAGLVTLALRPSGSIAAAQGAAGTATGGSGMLSLGVMAPSTPAGRVTQLLLVEPLKGAERQLAQLRMQHGHQVQRSQLLLMQSSGERIQQLRQHMQQLEMQHQQLMQQARALQQREQVCLQLSLQHLQQPQSQINALKQQQLYNETQRQQQSLLQHQRDLQQIRQQHQQVQSQLGALVQAHKQARAQAEAQAQAHAEAEAQVQAQVDAEARAQEQARAEVQAKADAKAKAMAQAQAEAQAKARAEAEAQRRAQEAAEVERRAQAQARAKQKQQAADAAAAASQDHTHQHHRDQQEKEQITNEQTLYNGLVPSEVACQDTLKRLSALPTRTNYTDVDVGEGRAAGSGPIGPMHEAGGQVLTALELARQARMAANRAFLKGLGMRPGAIHTGDVPALGPQDALVVQAARQLATKAALASAEQQLSAAQRDYDARVTQRRQEEPRLLAKVAQLKEDEAAAKRLLDHAEEAVKELKKEAVVEKVASKY